MKIKSIIVIGIVLASIVLGYIAFERYVQSQCTSMPGYFHSPNPVSLWDCLDYLDDKRTSEINQNEPIHDDRTRVEGKIADEICDITGGECPSYYIGNIQEDGSILVIMTFSDTIKEKQFTFFIKNDTLSYDVREN